MEKEKIGCKSIIKYIKQQYLNSTFINKAFVMLFPCVVKLFKNVITLISLASKNNNNKNASHREPRYEAKVVPKLHKCTWPEPLVSHLVSHIEKHTYLSSSKVLAKACSVILLQYLCLLFLFLFS